MAMGKILRGCVAPLLAAALAACGGGDDGSLRDALSRLPQDTSSFDEEDEPQEAPVPVADSAELGYPGPLTLPDTLGFFEAPPAAPVQPVQPDTGPRGLTPAPPSDTRPWIPEGPDSLPPSAEWTTASVIEPTANAGMAVLASVRTARNDGYDRVVFEFRGPRVPGFRVEYVDPPIRRCGSGQPVLLSRGQSWLRIRLEPSQAHDDRGRATVEDRERRIDLPVVREMMLICDYEGQVEWMLGASGRRPFRVTRLSSPTRLIVDLRH